MSKSNPPSLIGDHTMTEVRIVSGGGGVERHLAVECEARGESVPIAACGDCERCVGMRLPRGREAGVVRCVSLSSDRKHPPKDKGLRAPVIAVMSRDIVCVTEDASVDTVAALLIDRGWNATAVVDADGVLVGMISKTDLLREAHDAAGTIEVVAPPNPSPEADPALDAVKEPPRSVGELMMPVVFAVPGHVELSRAAALMAMENLHQLPVLSEKGAVVGILTSLDVLAWIAELDGYSVHALTPQPEE